MFTNHLKAAWRNILKRKEFSFINVLGLSIGMAACLLILQYVQFEKSYDNFHPDLSQLYRLNLGMSNPGEPEFRMASNHPAAGPSLQNDYPQVEEIVRLVPVEIFAGSSVLIYKPEGGQALSFYEENMFVADSTVLTVFGYPLIVGDVNTALSSRKNIVISENLAKRYFGDADPMGKTLSINGGFEMQVTGVLKDLPENTHLKISALFSSAFFTDQLNSSWIWPEFYTYVKLTKGSDVTSLESQLDGFVNKYLGDVMKEFGIAESMYLQPVSDIHLQSNLSKEVQENGSAKTISFLVLIAVLILLIAWINYINLSTARSIERASEVGVRKVVGAQKMHLITQFLVESGLMNLFAILLAILLVLVATPAFNLLMGRSIISNSWMIDLLLQGSTWLVLAGLFLGGTLLAGLYPAFVLSSFDPIKTLKGKNYTTGKKFHARHVMVVFQFAIGILLITGTLIVFNQLSYMRNQDLGFNMDQMLVIKAPSITDSTYSEKAKLLKDQLTQEPNIHYFTSCSDIPGHAIQNVNSIKKEGQSTDEGIFVTYIFTDEDYLPSYEIELIAGRNFSKDRLTDQESVILNKKAVELLGLTPEEALGKVISWKFREWGKVTVVGIVENVNHRSLAFERTPFAYFYRTRFTEYYSLKVNPKNLPSTIASIERTYEQIFPGNPFEYFFLDDYFANQYEADQRFGKVFSLFAGLAILVACLGLFGFASYTTARRRKEIGVRKVLGASVGQILMLLGKQFTLLVLIAAVVAIPLAWWFGDQWLGNYAYRSELSIWIFIVPIILVLGIAILTIFWQSLQAALTNPVDALRTE